MTTLTDLDLVADENGGLIIENDSCPGASEGILVESLGSVSCWIEDARKGCEWAAARLWERYRDQILSLARRKLGDASRTVSDEEDVAVMAFHSFLRRSRGGAYPDLSDRHQLWKLLVTITVHKALNQLRGDHRMKRGGEISSAPNTQERHIQEENSEWTSNHPEPDVMMMMSEWMDNLIDSLEDQELRQIAIAKLNGYSNQEIAGSIQRSLPTVERRLRLIRDKWREELPT